MAVALLLMLSAVPACRFPVHPERAAMTAATSFVLRSVFDLQSRVPLTQNSVRPARQATVRCAQRRHRMLLVGTYSEGRLVITEFRTL
jgi:hypothetical protein